MNRSRASHLEPYRKKRDPERTPEPFGGAPAAPLLPGPRFVVQKHWARALHYDLRLELDGVLKSWAVPRGPSTKAEERRLAVHVEDHPLEYADFEGVVPAGNYGAGSVIVWDRGWYGSFKPEPILEQFERGKLELELFGSKLRGHWTLVRMGGKGRKGGQANEWLLLKKVDGAASEREAVDRYPESVITGLTVEQVRDVPGHLAALREQVAATGAPRRQIDPRAVPFTLATAAEQPFSGKDWLFEIKYDGVRLLAARRGDEVLLLGRSGEDITARYPEIAAAARALPAPDLVLDGEIIATDEHGQPSFQRLQARMLLTRPRDVAAVAARVPVRGVFFDALALAGHDLRKLPLAARKDLLRRVVPPLGTIQASDHVLEHGEAFFEAVSEMRLEGVLAKRLTSAYTGKRTTDWIKIKCQRRQEFVIGGYTEPQGARGWFGALHIGVHDEGGLVYVTKVGTGFDEATLRRLHQTLQPLRRAGSPFVARSPAGAGHTWVEPTLVCEVRFTEWTRDGGLRHPTFLGLRADRRPEDCRREQPIAPAALVPAAEPPPAEDPGAIEDGVASRPEVKLTNLKKVFWAAEGYTKGDLIAYYEAVAPLLLPYLRDRPLVLTRYPDGIEGKSFFQKDAPQYAHEFVRTETVYSSDAEREIDYFVVDDAAALRYVANLGTIPLHVWSARIGSLERPDWLVLDLDPKSAPFAHVVEVARTLHRLLEELGLESFVKTSGASGLHILLPLAGRYTHEETRTFARLLATLGVEASPESATVVRAIQSREGKVYIDFGQNGHGNTIVAPYSVRPLPGAPASCPLRWDEVNGKLDPARYTIRTIPERFARAADPLARVLEDGIDMAAAIGRIERRMTSRGEEN